MKIGLLIAIERELQAFLALGSEIHEEQVNHRTVYRAGICGHTVYALCSGFSGTHCEDNCCCSGYGITTGIYTFF